MKNWHFYLEYPSATEKHKGTVKEPGNHSGTVLAVWAAYNGPGTTDQGLSISQGKVMYETCLCSVFEHADSVVTYSSASLDYIRERCKRIPEELARQIHPTLFRVLDADEKERLEEEKARLAEDKQAQ